MGENSRRERNKRKTSWPPTHSFLRGSYMIVNNSCLLTPDCTGSFPVVNIWFYFMQQSSHLKASLAVTQWAVMLCFCASYSAVQAHAMSGEWAWLAPWCGVSSQPRLAFSLLRAFPCSCAVFCVTLQQCHCSWRCPGLGSISAGAECGTRCLQHISLGCLGSSSLGGLCCTAQFGWKGIWILNILLFCQISFLMPQDSSSLSSSFHSHLLWLTGCTCQGQPWIHGL